MKRYLGKWCGIQVVILCLWLVSGCSEDGDNKNVQCPEGTHAYNAETKKCEPIKVGVFFDGAWENKSFVWQLDANKDLKLATIPSSVEHKIFLGEEGKDYQASVTLEVSTSGLRIELKSDEALGFGTKSLYAYFKDKPKAQLSKLKLGVAYVKDGKTQYLRNTISGDALQALMAEYTAEGSAALEGFGTANQTTLETQVVALVKELNTLYKKP